MDLQNMARQCISLLAASHPQASFAPTESTEVTRKGGQQAQVVKRIVLGRLATVPLCRELERRSGDAYRVLVGEELLQFNFAVTAQYRKVWWANITSGRLKKLEEEGCVFLAAWNRPEEDSSSRRLWVFCFSPRVVLDGVRTHEQALAESFVRTTLKKIADETEKLPGLMPLVRERLHIDTFASPTLPREKVMVLRDKLDALVEEYRSKRPGGVSDADWEKTRATAQKVRDRLWTILLQIEPDPATRGEFRLIHQKTASELFRFKKETGLFVPLELSEFETDKLVHFDKAAGEEEEEKEEEDYKPPPPPPQETYGIDDAMAGLFMPREQFETILSALRARKNVVLQGPPGVGKTFVARRVAWTLLGSKDNARVQMVQFHQSYAYEDFIQGWRPSGDGGFQLRNGVFYEFCNKARMDLGRPYVFIVDEINRGNLSKILGELMILIEPDKRGSEYAIPLTYSEAGERFSVPENIHVLGLMNTADRSLAMVDYALRRRFRFVELLPQFDCAGFADHLREHQASDELVRKIVKRMTALNQKIESDYKNLGRGFTVGHSFFCITDPNTLADEAWYRSVIAGEIAPLIEEYWFDRRETAKKWVEELVAP